MISDKASPIDGTSLANKKAPTLWVLLITMPSGKLDFVNYGLQSLSLPMSSLSADFSFR